MKKVACTDKYSGKTYTVVEDITEEDRKDIRTEAEKRLTQRAKSKRIRGEYLKAYRNRG